MTAHLTCVLCGATEIVDMHPKELRYSDQYSMTLKGIRRLYTCDVCEKLLFPPDVLTPDESRA